VQPLQSYVHRDLHNPLSGKVEFYYRCNGKHGARGLYGANGERCPSKDVNGTELERTVWSDVEAFLREPGPVLQQLQTKLQSEAEGATQNQQQLSRLEGVLAQKATERGRVLALFRRGRLSDPDVDAQMDEIDREEKSLASQADELRSKLTRADSINTTVSSVEALLVTLRNRLDEPISWELKRNLIEILVGGIRVDVIETGGVRQSATTVTYRFSQPDQTMTLLLPQSYNDGAHVQIPSQLKTVGDHIRRRRLVLKMLQRDVAERIGVDKCSIYNWETNRTKPSVEYMSSIIHFLGYNPLSSSRGLG